MGFREQKMFALAMGATVLSAGAHAQITVDTPKNGVQVCPFSEIAGRVEGPVQSASNGRLWIVVRPRTAGECWVQDPVSVLQDGSWSGYAHFGDAAAGQDGTPFEFRVMVMSTTPPPGKIACWPAAVWASPAVSVSRRPASQCR